MNLLTIRESDITADTPTVRLQAKNTGIQVTEVLMRGKDMGESLRDMICDLFFISVKKRFLKKGLKYTLVKLKV